MFANTICSLKKKRNKKIINIIVNSISLLKQAIFDFTRINTDREKKHNIPCFECTQNKLSSKFLIFFRARNLFLSNAHSTLCVWHISLANFPVCTCYKNALCERNVNVNVNVNAFIFTTTIYVLRDENNGFLF